MTALFTVGCQATTPSQDESCETCDPADAIGNKGQVTLSFYRDGAPVQSADVTLYYDTDVDCPPADRYRDRLCEFGSRPLESDGYVEFALDEASYYFSLESEDGSVRQVMLPAGGEPAYARMLVDAGIHKSFAFDVISANDGSLYLQPR